MTADNLFLCYWFLYDTNGHFDIAPAFKTNLSASRSDDIFCFAMSAEQKYSYPSAAIRPGSAVKIFFSS
jgi:hypothetical protein